MSDMKPLSVDVTQSDSIEMKQPVPVVTFDTSNVASNSLQDPDHQDNQVLRRRKSNVTKLEPDQINKNRFSAVMKQLRTVIHRKTRNLEADDHEDLKKYFQYKGTDIDIDDVENAMIQPEMIRVLGKSRADNDDLDEEDGAYLVAVYKELHKRQG